MATKQKNASAKKVWLTPEFTILDKNKIINGSLSAPGSFKINLSSEG